MKANIMKRSRSYFDVFLFLKDLTGTELSIRPLSSPVAWATCATCILCTALLGCDYLEKEKVREADGRLVVPKARTEKPSFLVINASEKETIRVVMEESGWVMKTPQEFPANNAKVEALLWNISRLRSDKVLLNAGKSKKKELGLESPCLELEFGRHGKPATKITAGCNVKKGLLAIQVRGENDVHLVNVRPDQIGANAHKALLSTQVLPINISNLKKILVDQADKGSLKLSLSDQNKWHIEGDFGKLPADPNKPYDLAKTLSEWSAHSILSIGESSLSSLPKKRALVIKLDAGSIDDTVIEAEDTKEVTKEVTKEGDNSGKTKDKTKGKTKDKIKTTTDAPSQNSGPPSADSNIYEAIVLGPCPKAAKSELLEVVRIKPYPARFCIKKELTAALDINPVKFLDGRPVKAERPALQSIQWVNKGSSLFKLVRNKTGQWQIVEDDNTRTADPNTVRETLGLLTENRAVSFKRIDSKNIKDKSQCLVYSTSKGTKGGSVCLANVSSPENQVGVVRDNEPIALVVPDKISKIINADPIHYQSRVLFSYRLPSLPNLFINRDGVMEKLLTAGSSHKLKSPVFGRPNSTAYSRLGGLFSRFTVKEFVSQAKAKTIINKPTLTLEVKPEGTIDQDKIESFKALMSEIANLLSEGTKALRLEIGEQTEKGECYGRMENTAFLLDKKSCKILKTPLAPIQIFHHLSGQLIVQMIFCRNNSCMSFINENGKWVSASKSTDTMPSQSVIRNRLAMVQGLRALEVSHYTAQNSRPPSAGRICLARRRKAQGADLGVHEDAEALLKECLYIGKEIVEAEKNKVRFVWVENRPIIYKISETLAERLLAPLK